MTTNPVVPFGAAPKSESFGDFHDGNVVSISGDRLVMSKLAGNEYSFRVAPDASVCCDRVSCRTEDIKVGSKVRLTTKVDDKNIVTRIESLNEQTEFAKRS